MESARNRPLDDITLQQFLIKGRKEKMHVKDFEEHMTLILDGCDAINEEIDISVKLERIDVGRRSYQLCKEHFKDEANNIHRWLLGVPLVFKHPVTECYLGVQVKEGFAPLYNLLEFCRLQNSGFVYGDEYFDTMSILVQASETIPQ